MDIVERLRNSSGQLDGLCDEAADEIERLRGLILEALNAGDSVHEFGTDLYDRMVSAVTPNV